jgi:hypothetical protein
VDVVLGGWKIAWTSILQTGQFFSPSFSGSDPSNTNTSGGRPDRVCNGNLASDQRALNRWFDTSCFVAPPAGRFGNAGVNILESPGLQTHNASFTKRFRLTERIALDYMATVSNIFNHPNFLAPASNVSRARTGGGNCVAAWAFRGRPKRSAVYRHAIACGVLIHGSPISGCGPFLT